MENLVILLGHLGADPKIIEFENGKIAKTSLATRRTYTKESGERVEITDWHKIVFKGKGAEIAEKYYKKGDLIYLTGRLETRSYEDSKGEKRYITEVVAAHSYIAKHAEGIGDLPT